MALAYVTAEMSCKARLLRVLSNAGSEKPLACAAAASVIPVR